MCVAGAVAFRLWGSMLILCGSQPYAGAVIASAPLHLLSTVDGQAHPGSAVCCLHTAPMLICASSSNQGCASYLLLPWHAQQQQASSMQVASQRLFAYRATAGRAVCCMLVAMVAGGVLGASSAYLVVTLWQYLSRCLMQGCML